MHAVEVCASRAAVDLTLDGDEHTPTLGPGAYANSMSFARKQVADRKQENGFKVAD